MKTGVLIVNLGTPATPDTKGVRAFHRKFFSDPFVFDMSPIGRWMLRNLIIIPFRSPKTAELYKEIWMEDGSPLKVYSDRVLAGVRKLLGEEYVVELGMGYSEPNIEQGMQKLVDAGVSKIVAFPMFPQCASSTTGSIGFGLNEVHQKIGKDIPLTIVPPFYNEPEFITSWGDVGKVFEADVYDHIVFSYHGLPERHIKNDDPNKVCFTEGCCDAVNEKNANCYRMQCYETSRLMAKELHLNSAKWTVAFQSRFGKDPWIQPYLNEKLKELSDSGKKNILVFSPSFVTDCLETIHEISIEYGDEFVKEGGEKLTLVPSLNDNETWINSISSIIRKATK